MKLLVKQNCTINGFQMGLAAHRKPGAAEVPASFIFDAYFCALLKEAKLVVTEILASELKELDEEAIENLSEEVKELLELVVIDDLTDSDEDEEEETEEDADDELEETVTEEVTVGDVSKKVTTTKKAKKKNKR